MTIVFNDKLNLFGILLDNLEYVAVQIPVYVAALEQRKVECRYVEQILLMDSDWETVTYY